MTHALITPLVLGLGTQELIIIFAVLVLLFGAKKLPELARGSGRALRIFKAETKGLIDDDEDDERSDAQKQIDAQHETQHETQHQSVTDASEPQSEDPGSTRSS